MDRTDPLPDTRPLPSPAELDVLAHRVGALLGDLAREHPAIEAVEAGEPGERRWYVRLRGEERDVATVRFTVGQRTLRHETWVLPAPRYRTAEVHAQLLRRNLDLTGVRFAVGDEGEIVLVGRLPLACVDPGTLDQLLGIIWSTLERSHRSLVRLAFDAGP